MGFIRKPTPNAISNNDGEIIKYEWIIEAIENLVYLDKPLPPMP